MSAEDIKLKIGKVLSNNHKLDEVILNLDKDIEILTAKRYALNEDVTKLNEQVVSIKKDLSNCEQIKMILEQEIKTKTEGLKTVVMELEHLKWQNTWHGIIAENQIAELTESYNRMEILEENRKTIKTNNIKYENVSEDKEIEQLTNENKALEQQIHVLKNSLPSQSTITNTKKEILTLQDRNETILKRMKCQLAQLENRNAQDKAYFNSLQKELK